ncbi:MAG: D-alanine--D-alanine ligase [Candidatus Latescibacteria bacterium]|nr:D-alanine--D-alanine ligase [Candidatus Latescibacterota bacterium]
MAKKIRVGVLFGGKSSEHEVSLQSARNVIDAIDKTKYEVVPIGIDKTGRWFLNEAEKLLPESNKEGLAEVKDPSTLVALIPEGRGELTRPSQPGSLGSVDVVFPVLHGPLGEDGTVQGLLKLADVPFVGPGVLGSAVAMDKDVMKRLIRDAGIPTPDFITVMRFQAPSLDVNAVVDRLGLPLFVKPANQGSSVGISKVNEKSELADALIEALRFDDKVLIEAFAGKREVECAVLGNEYPESSIPGEVLPLHDFYSYEAKYLDENGAVLKIPADLSDEQVKEVQDLAVRTFQVLCCEGMARVDCFLTDDNKWLVNEVNTIPGFTRISMYPKLWEASGMSYTDLVDKLIQLAIERYEREQKLKTTFDF